MKVLIKFSKLIDALNQRVGKLICWLVLVMILVGAYNSLARYFPSFCERFFPAFYEANVDGIFSKKFTTNALMELQWHLFAIVFLLGGAYTLLKDAHVRVDVIYDRLSPIKQALINITLHSLFLIPFCVVMMIVSKNKIFNAWADKLESSDPGGLPLYYLYTFIWIGLSLLILQALSQIIKAVYGMRALK